MKLTQTLVALILTTTACASFAAEVKPMPNKIVVQEKAIVPVVKTEIIRTLPGQAPQRQVQATVFEVTNKGKDIVARDIDLTDNQSEFSERSLATPILQKGGVIVPTSKIEVSSRLKEGGEVVAQTRTIDAAGVEFKKGVAEPVHRTLQLGQLKDPQADVSATRAVMTENGVTTRDVIVVTEPEKK